MDQLPFPEHKKRAAMKKAAEAAFERLLPNGIGVVAQPQAKR
jgi:hypothetical protein